MHRHSFILLFLSLIQFIHSSPVPGNAVLLRIPNDPRLRPTRPTRPNNFCFNSAVNRSCWGGGYSIDTNIEASWPNTGRVVSYTLDIQNKTMAPDGFSRPVYAVNGQFPGPTIRARWGDTLRVTVKNSLQTNGTSIHWHGVRQYKTNPMDGTNGITECPLAPGQSRTYTFLATQHGTSWYHSHHSSQYSDGVWGTIVIDGPSTANYDVDLGVLPVNDWFHEPAFSTLYKLARGQIRGAPRADNVLINGTNVNSTGGGTYHKNTIEKGKTYRLRFVNTGTLDHFKIGLDKHNFTVMAVDFVPVMPYNTSWISLAVGQRTDVVFTANQDIDSYWLHVVGQTGCSNNNVLNAVSIFSYKGANNTMPSNSTRSNAPLTNDCFDQNVDLIPWVPLNVPNNETIPRSSRLDVGFAVVQNSTSQEQTVVQWNLNKTAIRASWDKPTLQYVREGNTSYPPNFNLISLPKRNTWSFWVIQAGLLDTVAPAQAHPVHLHGHDFYVLGAGTGIYDDSTTLNYVNPVRRDVAVLPAKGYLVLAFYTDNPGAWLMHCHVAWHIDLGFGAHFLERVDEIPALLNQTQGWNQQCSSWDTYEDTAVYHQEGSGL